jgi:hypothetical protein
VKATVIMTEGTNPSNTFVTAVPQMDAAVRDLASAKLGAINDFYNARAEISRLNKELFDQGLIIGHDLMCW